MFIYKITNTVNNKVYIGKTIHSVDKRFSRHLYTAKKGMKTKFYNAIRKYGENNFEVEVLEVVKNKNLLNEREMYWIQKYDSLNSGYNSTVGGDGGDTFKYKSEKEKKSIIQKIQKSRSHLYKSVVCVDTFNNKEEIFDTIQECVEWLELMLKTCVEYSAVHQRASGVIQSLYCDRFEIKYQQPNPIQKSAYNKTININHSPRKVLCENVITKKSYVFDSMRECCRFVGSPNDVKSIKKRCMGVITSPYHNRWMFSFA